MPTIAARPLDELLPILRSPDTGDALLQSSDDQLATPDGTCRYPVVSGVAILLAADNPLFDARSFAAPTRHRAAGPRAVVRKLLSRLPQGSRNVGAAERYARLAELLQRSPGSRVLIVGAGMLGAGSRALLDAPDIEIVETDVTIGPRTTVVCDGHRLPFADGAFDAVVCQAVLEHVLEPWTVVAEIHRVLAEDGLVYSEIPFMQQVHEGAYDFTRFTHLGHRRLFRRFEELDSGAQGGPGMALSWSLQYFAMAFTRSRATRAIVQRMVGVLTGWLTIFDPWLVRRPGGLDAASGTWFLGRRSDRALGDDELVEGYRGGCPSPR